MKNLLNYMKILLFKETKIQIFKNINKNCLILNNKKIIKKVNIKLILKIIIYIQTITIKIQFYFNLRINLEININNQKNRELIY